MESEQDDIDKDIQRLKTILEDNDGDASGSDGELKILEDDDQPVPDHSRPSTSSDVTASSFPTTSVCTDADDALIRFDPSTITAETCLAMNRAYQEVLLDTLRQVEISLAENRDKQQQRQDMINSYNSGKPVRSKELKLTNFAAPFFKDSSGQCPPPNEDVVTKEKMQENKIHVKPKVPWTVDQRKSLLNAVTMDALEQLLRPLISKLELETEKANNCKTTEEIEKSKERIRRLTEEINEKKQFPTEELLKNFDESKIDFMKISVVHMSGKYDAVDCECMWKNVLRPSINKKKWSSKEEEKLSELISKHNMRDWKQIAEELGTSRTPFQCFQHYQREHFSYDQSDWTEAEDELLKEVVETCKYGTGRIIWKQVAYYIDRRSPKQCENRWKQIDKQTKRGKWNELEDMLLLAAVQTFGMTFDWAVIKEFVPGRSAAQCKERYMNSLNESINFDEFTYAEDRQLLNSYQKLGNNWTAIATQLKSRTGAMTMNRYKKLMQWQQMTEVFFNQTPDNQQRQISKAFDLSPAGGFQLKNLAELNVDRRRGRPLGSRQFPKGIEKLQEGSKAFLGINNSEEVDQKANIQAGNIKQEPIEIEDSVEAEESSDAQLESIREIENLPQVKAELQGFLKVNGFAVQDYERQLRDMSRGIKPVPRPPPVNETSLRRYNSNIVKRNELDDMLLGQVEKYVASVGNVTENRKEEARAVLQGLMSLAEQKEQKNYRSHALGSSRPSDLTVRELLQISRKMLKRAKKRQKRRKTQNPLEREDSDYTDDDDDEGEDSDFQAPWELSSDEEDMPKRVRRKKSLVMKPDESEDESDLEFFAKLEMEAQKLEKLKTRTKKNSEQDVEKFRKVMDAHKNVNSDLRSVVKCKLNIPLGRKKINYMYQAYLFQSKKHENTLTEKKKIMNKSLMLLLKTLDVDTTRAFRAACQSKRRIAAMAMLKSADRVKRTRAQTALPKHLPHMNELNEVSELMMNLRQELNITEEADIVTVDEETESGTAQAGTSGQAAANKARDYSRCLPYIPPNHTNLKGMKMLLLDHRCLIDQACEYFDVNELRTKLYNIKALGPNPLLNVLMAMGKSPDSLVQKKRGFGPKPSEFKNMTKKAARQLGATRMAKIRNSYPYKKLMARFKSVFLWPALMSTIPIPRGQTLPATLLKEVISDTGDTITGEVLDNSSETPAIDQSQNASNQRGSVLEPLPTSKSNLEISVEDDVATEIDQNTEETISEKVVPDIRYVSKVKEKQVKVEGNKVADQGSETKGDVTEEKDVNPEPNEQELDEDIPEEEAIEKLVQKILEEYGHSKKSAHAKKTYKRQKWRRLSAKEEKGHQNRRRTMVLKRLGLYEKMKEYEEKRKQMTEQNPVPSKSSTSVAASDSNTDSELVEPVDEIKKDEDDTPSIVQSSSHDQQTAPQPLISSMRPAAAVPVNTEAEGRQTTESSETTGSAATTGAKKPGRKKGVKLSCYDPNQTPTRRSGREVDKTHSYAPPKTRKAYIETNVRLKTLVPELDIVSKISEVPILNEPMPEISQKKTKQAKGGTSMETDKNDEPKGETSEMRVDVNESKNKIAKKPVTQKRGKGKLPKVKRLPGMSYRKLACRTNTGIVAEVKKDLEAQKQVQQETLYPEAEEPIVLELLPETERKEAFSSLKSFRDPKMIIVENSVNGGDEQEQFDVKDTSHKSLCNSGSFDSKEILVASKLTEIKTESKAETPRTAAEKYVSQTKLKDSEIMAKLSARCAENLAEKRKTESAALQHALTSPKKQKMSAHDKVAKISHVIANAGNTNQADKKQNSETSSVVPNSGNITPTSQGNIPIFTAAPAAQLTMPDIIGSVMQQAGGGQSSGPIIIPIPVTVGDTQQMAYMPLFADADGKYRMPDGQEIDTASAALPYIQHVGTLKTPSQK